MSGGDWAQAASAAVVVGAVIFSAGAVRQQLRDLSRRVGRIEDRLWPVDQPGRHRR